MTATLTHDRIRQGNLERMGWLAAVVIVAFILFGLLLGGADLSATDLMADPNFAA